MLSRSYELAFVMKTCFLSVIDDLKYFWANIYAYLWSARLSSLLMAQFSSAFIRRIYSSYSSG